MLHLLLLLLHLSPSLPPPVDDEGRGFVSAPHLTFPHPYPPTKLQWVPDKDGTRPDLLASSGDHLRLWRVGAEGVRLEQLLSNVSARGPGVWFAFGNLNFECSFGRFR